MRTALLLSLFLFCFSASSFADTQVISLKDGSQIKGELIGIQDGVYTIKTPVIGEVHVKSSEVTGINAEGAVPAPSAPQPMAATGSIDINTKMQEMQSQLMSNPDAMAEIQQIASDPAITQLLSDPELMRIVMSKDVNAIQNSPKAAELMNNPRIKNLIQKLQGTSSQ